MSPAEPDPAPPAGMVEVWRGAVNPWRCDEMGHMNMRYYLAIAEEGLGALAHALGQPRAFAPGAVSTLRAHRWRVRYLREARAGDSLYARAGVLELGAEGARVLVMIHHGDGRPSAGLVATLVHATPDGRSFPWSKRARTAAAGLACALPDEARPRGMGDEIAETPSAARAEALGLVCIARGAVGGDECDAFGQMTAAAVFGRVSDGTTALLAPMRQAMVDAHPGRRIGGAALEYVLALTRPPRRGELIEVRSGLARLDEKVIHPRHWLLDPAGGEPYGALRGVGASLDLDTRRIVPIPPALREGFATPGLA